MELRKLFTSRKRQFIYVLLFLTVGFILLSLFVLLVPPSVLDIHISEEIQEHNNAFLDVSMKAISWFGNIPQSIVIVVAVAMLFRVFRHKREAVFTLLTLTAGIISTLLKMLINRPRPTNDLVTIIEVAKQQSFPSGHTFFYTVFFGFLIVILLTKPAIARYVRRSVIAISLLMIFLVPISRVYLGAHWFSDVLGGFIGGILWLALLGYFYTKTPQQ